MYFSIIVPVYKAEKWLDRCVESILRQTFGDFELILVDDGSPDRCGALCDAYAARDGRVRAVHRPNGGPAAARNTGLAAMSAGGGTSSFSTPTTGPSRTCLRKSIAL